MALSHSQRAMVYLVSKRLSNQDFCAFMDVTPQRASQMVNWRHSSHRWSEKNRQLAINATNGGLDVYADIWEKIEKLLDKMAIPTVTFKKKKSA